MRHLTAVLLVALLVGCGAGESSPGVSTSENSQNSETPSPDAPSPDAPTSATACAEVRAGIAAFNDGDYDETVARFRDAVPLAETEAEEADAGADADAAELLLEAVEYYADLAPEDYLESSQTSPDFERYKQITLGQCVADEPPASEEPPGVEI